MAFERDSAEITIKGLDSLETLYLKINSFEINFFLRNLSSLKTFHLFVPNINDNMLSSIFDQLPYIEELSLHGKFNYISLDNLVNLRRLCLHGTICDDFNIELFKNVSSQLEELLIALRVEYEVIFKLLNGRDFSNIRGLKIKGCNMRRVEKKFIDQFPTLIRCRLVNCSIEIIEYNAFSSLKKLILLDLSENLLKGLFNRYFLGLNKLKYLYFYKNPVKYIEDGIVSKMKVFFDKE